MKCAPLVALLLSLLTVCTANAAALSPTPATATSLNKIAEAYVKLVLALGQHDPDYVDAYYGPPEWKQQLQGKKPLDSLALEANRLRDQLAKISTPADEMERLRLAYLTNQLSALDARVRILKGERLKFDEESQALYDAVAPRFPESHFKEVLAKLEEKLPGEGPLLQAVRELAPRIRNSERQTGQSISAGDPGMSRTHNRAHRAAAQRKFQRRIRHQQTMGRLQLVQRQLSQRHPGEHRSAGIH